MRIFHQFTASGNIRIHQYSLTAEGQIPYAIISDKSLIVHKEVTDRSTVLLRDILWKKFFFCCCFANLIVITALLALLIFIFYGWSFQLMPLMMQTYFKINKTNHSRCDHVHLKILQRERNNCYDLKPTSTCVSLPVDSVDCSIV